MNYKVKESQRQFIIFLEVYIMFGLVPFNRRANEISSRNDLFDFASIFDNFFNDSFTPAFFTASQPIKADIREMEKEYVIEADMPGVKKEDIKLDLRDGVLTIGVEHNEQVEEKRENYIRKERKYGSYCRSFNVDGVNQEGVTAKYSDGVLTVNLPKSEDARPKTHRIDIQ